MWCNGARKISGGIGGRGFFAPPDGDAYPSIEKFFETQLGLGGAQSYVT